MKILALDPSLSSTGFALFNTKTKKELITQGKITTNNKDSRDVRIQNIIYLLSSEFKTDLDAVILEDGYVGTNASSSLKLAELRGALIFFYKYNNIDVIHRLPTEIRKNFGLKGNAKKEDVAKEVLKYYPKLINDVGPYSDKANKQKTSDIYDAISIGLSYIIHLKE